MKKDNKHKAESLGPTGPSGPQEYCGPDGTFGKMLHEPVYSTGCTSSTSSGTTGTYYCATAMSTKTKTVTRLVYKVNKKGKEVLKKKVVETITESEWPSYSYPYTLTTSPEVTSATGVMSTTGTNTSEK